MTTGIPTTYSSSRFRSRLEARWAAFFDLIGWRWTYEPFDAEGYIPDFLIHGDHPFFVEVGPCITTADYGAKAEKPDRAMVGFGHDVLIVGATPLVSAPTEPDGVTWDEPGIGWLGEMCPAWEDEPAALSWGWGLWFCCETCYVIGFRHAWNSYSGRPTPCGHHKPYSGEVHQDQIEALWREAGNRVQWNAR